MSNAFCDPLDNPYAGLCDCLKFVMPTFPDPLGLEIKYEWIEGGEMNGTYEEDKFVGLFFGNGSFWGIHFSRVTFQKRTKRRVAGLARGQALRDETVALIKNP